MNINEHTNIYELLATFPECRESLFPFLKTDDAFINISELSANCNANLTSLLSGIERNVKRVKQNPYDYSQMKKKLIKSGTVNIAGFVSFLWQEPFIRELKEKADRSGIKLNINIFPKHLKKQFQNYLSVCNDPVDLPEILIGKGFSSLMTSRFVETFVKPGHYCNTATSNNMSNFFRSTGFADPFGSYHPFGIEELVMVYDASYSEVIDPPGSWKDILKPGYKGMLGQMGKNQQDHFGFIMMLYLYLSFGTEGIACYARNVKYKQHFTHTIRNIGTKSDMSAPVNIMHQFAAKLIRSNVRDQVYIINTKEGNPSVCHFFMLKNKADMQAAEIVDHLYSKQIKNIIEKGGTTHISSSKLHSGNKTIRWIGWDTLRELPLPYLKEYLSKIAYNHFKL